MWLDTPLHQATGLHSFTPEQQLRLLTVASQPGADSAPLELLWQLCSVLQRLSYAVVVLDGTAAETELAPGLAHLVDGTPWPGGAAAARTALAVVPAARGLARLAHRHPGGEPLLAPLVPLLRSYAVAVVYAPAELLAPLVAGTACVPLLMTGPGAQGLVGSYRRLKHLALHGGVQCCTVAALKAPQALATLQRSAHSHLGMRVHTTSVAAERAQDIQRLALQLLEIACTMDAAVPPLPLHGSAAHPAAAAFLDRSH